MVHLTRPMGRTPIEIEAREIARAAHDAGVSIGFAVALRDRNPLIYGDHSALLDTLDPRARALVEATWLSPMPPPDEQIAQVAGVAEAVADMPGQINAQYGPTGVQWCSDELLAGVAAASRKTGRRVHMHLLETPAQREWADRAFSTGIVEMRDAIGLLSDRLTLAYCVRAKTHELDLIARSSTRIAVNASSNLHLSSRIAPVPGMMKAGVQVAMGLDGCALDEDDDGLRE